MWKMGGWDSVDAKIPTCEYETQDTFLLFFPDCPLGTVLIGGARNGAFSSGTGTGSKHGAMIRTAPTSWPDHDYFAPGIGRVIISITDAETVAATVTEFTGSEFAIAIDIILLLVALRF